MIDEEWEEEARKITKKVYEICEDIVEKKDNTKYQEALDCLFEFVEKYNLHIPENPEYFYD